MNAKKRRRAGATETFSVSVDPTTKRRLKELADERHAGNVSALITALSIDAERKAAFERAWQWYGGPEPSASERAALLEQWAEGWELARKPKKKRRAA